MIQIIARSTVIAQLLVDFVAGKNVSEKHVNYAI